MPHRPAVPTGTQPVDNLDVQELMKDPAYWNRDDPAHERVKAAVTRHFQAQGRMAEVNGTAMKPFDVGGR